MPDSPISTPVSRRDLDRLLCGPGPANPYPSVAAATGLPLVGHLDPVFSDILDELAAGLRVLFGTANPVTFAASGTGSAGMELLAANLVEPGDTVVAGVNGVFGGRIREACEKLGATVVAAEAPWGESIDAAALHQALMAAGGSAEVVWLVHAETSTGVRQPDVAALAEIAHDHGALFLLDTVTSLGGWPLELDAWGVDAAFSGSQKCLGVTPGLAPVTLGERALAKFRARKAPVPSWYLDLDKLLGYWDAKGGRKYHHTAPIAPLYGLHEAVRLVLEEGRDAAAARFRAAGERLAAGLAERGFTYAVADPERRLPMLHCVYPPEGVGEAALRRDLMQHESVEIGGGLGDFAGRAVRIGLMGANAQPEVIDRLLAAIDRALARQP